MADDLWHGDKVPVRCEGGKRIVLREPDSTEKKKEKNR